VDVASSEHCQGNEDDEQGGKHPIDDEQKRRVEGGTGFQNTSKERTRLWLFCVRHGSAVPEDGISPRHPIAARIASRGCPVGRFCTAFVTRQKSHLPPPYLTGRVWGTCTGWRSLPDTITLLHDMDVASFAKIAVKLAGDLCGVPGIPILADAVVTLIETCESIPKQKQVHKLRAPLTDN